MSSQRTEGQRCLLVAEVNGDSPLVTRTIPATMWAVADSVVREILGSNAYVVRFWLLNELNSGNGGTSLEKAARDSVHPVYHLTFCSEDHGICEINGVHKLHVAHKDSHGVWRTISSKPVDRVQLLDRRERHEA